MFIFWLAGSQIYQAALLSNPKVETFLSRNKMMEDTAAQKSKN